MRAHVSILAMGLLAGCMGSGGTGVDVAPAAGSVERSLAAIDANAGGSFDQMLNGVRAVNGADPLSFDNRLARAAEVHANDMLQNRFFDHVGSDDSSVGTRVTRQGYVWSRVGENIARGQQSNAEVMEDWTESSGHHRNNINPNYRDFGLGKAGSGSSLHWVLVLATPG